MRLELKRELEIIVLTRGLSGILKDIAEYCSDSAYRLQTCNNIESAKIYNKSAYHISKLALEIEQEGE